ncbi:MAG: hypothetical protein DRH44_05410 [Candidatus Coatesbacteria bacterium]|nr:MAG: hypothetical protein DRH44_05410 [Candidatus Coatesbacteria bacterium]
MAGENRQSEVRFTRTIGLFSATSIGIGAMIGAGIFVLSGIAVGYAGPAAIISYILAALITLFTALSYSELASSIPIAGGGYTYVHEAIGGSIAFMTGWSICFGCMVSCSLYAVGFAEHFLEFFHSFGIRDIAVTIIGIVIALFFVLLNIKGTKESVRTTNVLVTLKVAILMIFALIVFFSGKMDFSNFHPFVSPDKGIGGIFRAITVIYVSFFGFEVISNAGEEIKNPEKNLPRAILLALLIPTLIYLCIVIVVIGVLGDRAGETVTPLVVITRTLRSPWLLTLVIIGGLFSTATALNSTLIASSRQMYAMGRDGYLPSIIGKLHTKRMTPVVALLVSAVIVLVFTVIGKVDFIAKVSNVALLFALTLVNMSVIILRKKQPDLRRPFKLPFHPVIPALGMLCSIAIVVVMDRTTQLLGLIYFLLGGIVYIVYAKGQKEKREKARKLQEIVEKQLRQEYKILVALSTLDNVRGIMRIACSLARKYKGEIVVMTVIEVPHGLPLEAGLGEVAVSRLLLNQAVNIAKQYDVSVTKQIKLSRRTSEAILETAEEEECNFIVIAREKALSLPERVVNTGLDVVLRKAPCDVALLKLNGMEKVKRIVYAAEDSADAKYALSILPAFQDEFNVHIVALHVIKGSPQVFEHLSGQIFLDELLKDCPIKIERKIIVAESVEEGIINFVEPTDLLVMGLGSSSFLERILFSSVSEEVSERLEGPVIMISRYVMKKQPLIKVLRHYGE